MTKDLVFAVKEGLEKDVVRVFHGVRDTETTEGDDDYLCYAVRPARRYFEDADREIKETEVLLVFLDDERVVFNFYWSETEIGDPRTPISSEDRFVTPIF